MFTSTLGGHVNITPEKIGEVLRRRRLHSDEFNANAVASCMRPGISMAAVAMDNGVNANLLRRWVQAAEMRTGSVVPDAPPTPKRHAANAPAAFVPMQLPVKAATTSALNWVAAIPRFDDAHRCYVARSGPCGHSCRDCLIACVVQVFGAAQAHHTGHGCALSLAWHGSDRADFSRQRPSN